MTNPLAITLQLAGLVLLMHGYAGDTAEWVTLGLLLALAGAIGYRRRIDSRKK